MKTAARSKRSLKSVEILRNSLDTDIKQISVPLVGTILQATAPDIHNPRPKSPTGGVRGSLRHPVALQTALWKPFWPPPLDLPGPNPMTDSSGERVARNMHVQPVECQNAVAFSCCYCCALYFSLHLTQHEECSRHCAYVDFRMTLTSREVHRAP